MSYNNYAPTHNKVISKHLTHCTVQNFGKYPTVKQKSALPAL